MHATSPTAVAAPPTVSAPRPRWIDDWRPEDRAFWAATGERVARRNLAFSIFSEHIGFCVWSMWSAFVLFLGPEYGLDPAQKFLLTTVPTAVGAALRIPYTLAVARFGGRNWTVASALLLLIPSIAAGIALEPGVSFGTLLFVAALAGIGGGNFSSSMATSTRSSPSGSRVGHSVSTPVAATSAWPRCSSSASPCWRRPAPAARASSSSSTSP